MTYPIRVRFPLPGPLRVSLLFLALVGLTLLIAGCGSVQDARFKWSVGPASIISAPGTGTEFNIQVTSRVLGIDPVSFRVTGVPDHMGATFDPADLPPGSTTGKLKITTDVQIPEGLYHLRIYAKEAGQEEKYEDVYVNVEFSSNFSDFTLEVKPKEHHFTGIEAPRTFTYTVRRRNGFTGRVDMLLGVHPDYMTVSGPTPNHVDLSDSVTEVTGTFTVDITYSAYAQPPHDQRLTAQAGSKYLTESIMIYFPL